MRWSQSTSHRYWRACRILTSLFIRVLFILRQTNRYCIHGCGSLYNTLALFCILSLVFFVLGETKWRMDLERPQFRSPCPQSVCRCESASGAT